MRRCPMLSPVTRWPTVGIYAGDVLLISRAVTLIGL